MSAYSQVNANMAFFKPVVDAGYVVSDDLIRIINSSPYLASQIAKLNELQIYMRVDKGMSPGNAHYHYPTNRIVLDDAWFTNSSLESDLALVFALTHEATHAFDDKYFDELDVSRGIDAAEASVRTRFSSEGAALLSEMIVRNEIDWTMTRINGESAGMLSIRSSMDSFLSQTYPGKSLDWATANSIALRLYSNPGVVDPSQLRKIKELLPIFNNFSRVFVDISSSDGNYSGFIASVAGTNLKNTDGSNAFASGFYTINDMWSNRYSIYVADGATNLEIASAITDIMMQQVGSPHSASQLNFNRNIGEHIRFVNILELPKALTAGQKIQMIKDVDSGGWVYETVYTADKVVTVVNQFATSAGHVYGGDIAIRYGDEDGQQISIELNDLLDAAIVNGGLLLKTADGIVMLTEFARQVIDYTRDIWDLLFSSGVNDGGNEIYENGGVLNTYVEVSDFQIFAPSLGDAVTTAIVESSHGNIIFGGDNGSAPENQASLARISERKVVLTGSLSQINASLASAKFYCAELGGGGISVTLSDASSQFYGITIVPSDLDGIGPGVETNAVLSSGVPIPGFSLDESYDSSQIHAVLTSSLGGLNLLSSYSGSQYAYVQSGNGGKELHLYGTEDQVNASLATLNYSAWAAGTDTITLTATDGNGGVSTPVSTSVVVEASALTSTAPTAVQGVLLNGWTAVTGFALDDSYDESQIHAVLTNSLGGMNLSSNYSGSQYAYVQGYGSHELHLYGTEAQVNASLATLIYTGSAAGTDTITLTATDGNGGVGAAASATVTVSTSVLTADGPDAGNTIFLNTYTPITGFVVDDSYDQSSVTAHLTASLGSMSLSGHYHGSQYAYVQGTSGKDLYLYGTEEQINASLATLIYTGYGAGTDTITLTATDSHGGVSAPVTASVSVETSVLATDGPDAGKSIFLNTYTPITGFMLDDSYDQSAVTAHLTASLGSMHLSGQYHGSQYAYVQGTSKDLYLYGTEEQVNASLATLIYTGYGAGTDAITLTATDSNGGVGAAVSTQIAVNPSALVATGQPADHDLFLNSTEGLFGFGLDDTYDESSVHATLTNELGWMSVASNNNGGSSQYAYAQYNGAHQLDLYGTELQVNASLSTLQYTGMVAGTDIVRMFASDSNGGIMAPVSSSINVFAFGA